MGQDLRDLERAFERLSRSRDQLAAILGSIAEGVTVQDQDGHLIYANAVAARMSGYDEPEALIRDSPNVLERFALLDEAGNPFLIDRLPGRRILHGETPEEVVVQFRDRQTSDWRWTILDAAPVRDEEGRLKLVVNIFRDITERKRHMDATDFLAAASTILGSTLDIDSSLQRLAELAVPRIADYCAIELLESDGLQRMVARAPIGAIEGAPDTALTLALVARGQRLGTLTLATTPHVDVGVANDLAGRISLAAENARVVADLQDALRTRDEFLASASHDLKNPLASIKATAQLLQRRLDGPDEIDKARLQEGLQRIDAISTRAAGLVEELLDLASLQMGRPLDLERQAVDLIALAREVAGEHQQATERHSLEVQADEDELLGEWDPRRLGRVLSNLLDNAIKYSPAGGKVVVRVNREDHWATLAVSDSGIGIPQAELERVFQRFQRGSNVAQRIGGTGLGLASARHIVDSHGGSIGVQSAEGAGATFIVRLPIEPSA